ncbi:AraC-like DNA-binding protein [Friedmanniella endophytica]|uniref:AraC-like DNA-binding protein n=1 Tax=Microlunatus kandeliicorticis TaxID=1759536 RepID=A0A7W3P5D3_9ACTN|nr:WhiB family transcriptional regulator [Microlunatus kandeliicorticis]MBA8793859.1 AraC-like DNA-binding protein [Microlunatus kandeliicorticis]
MIAPQTHPTTVSDTRSTATRPGSTPCVTFAGLFQDRLLEEPPSNSAPAAERRRYAALVEQAAEICAACPVQARCLYTAVVEHDVAGFVGGTTPRQRAEIRKRLGVEVAPEDFDTLAGVTAPNREVDHAEVVRLRAANPQETLEQIAQRLGCSLSTVKRHLRRARAEAAAESDPDRVTVLRREPRTSPAQVLAVTAAVLGTGLLDQSAA